MGSEQLESEKREERKREAVALIRFVLAMSELFPGIKHMLDATIMEARLVALENRIKKLERDQYCCLAFQLNEQEHPARVVNNGWSHCPWCGKQIERS